MKSIYLAISTQLATISELNYIDLDKGQLEFEGRPGVSFPVALLDLQISRTEDLGNGRQECTGLLSIRFGYDFLGKTSHITPETNRAEALKFYDLAETIYNTLQNWKDSNGEFGYLNRENLRTERRLDGLKVATQTFSFTFRQATS